MKTLKTLKAEMLAKPEVHRVYEDLAPEYEIAREVIRARLAAGLSQDELAERMETSQSFIAKLESGHTLPSMRTLKRVAKATGTRACFSLVAA